MRSKPHRLRETAEGFMARLVAACFEGPFRWAHYQWEGPFYRVCGSWAPQRRTPQEFPRFRVGGVTGVYSQPRDMLRRLTRTSPFHEYQTEPLPRDPMNLSPEEYLEVWAQSAEPEEGGGLAVERFSRRIGLLTQDLMAAAFDRPVLRSRPCRPTSTTPQDGSTRS